MARTPYVSLVSGGTDLIPVWGPLLVDATVTDERGEEADKLSVTLDDLGGRVAYPPTGARIVVSGGYRETGAAVTGEYVVDSIALEGWPQRIVIEASSVEAAKPAAKERKTETHKQEDVPTVGDLIDRIAGRVGLQPVVQAAVRAIPIVEAVHQTEMSDLAFVNHTVRQHDAMMAVKSGRLVVVRRGSMQSASGKPIAPVVVAPRLNLLSYRVRWSDRPLHGKVETRYYDRGGNETRTLEVPVGKQGGPGASSSDVVARLREPFPTEEEARQAAEARAREITRGDGSATFEIEGDPTVGAEIPVLAQGIRSGVDGLWVPTRVEHSWSGSSGYRTRIEAETPGQDSRGDGGSA